jgi:hypothetical protein
VPSQYQSVPSNVTDSSAVKLVNDPVPLEKTHLPGPVPALIAVRSQVPLVVPCRPWMVGRRPLGKTLAAEYLISVPTGIFP